MKKLKINDNDLLDILINPKLNTRGQYICDCPFCGKEKHFYISKETQLFDCKKCGENGSIYKLLKSLDKTYLLQGATIEDREKLSSIRETIEEQEQIELKQLPIIKMPVGWKVFKKDLPYLKNRGISISDCERYNIGRTTFFKKYDKYVLIPVFDDNSIKGFVGRYSEKKPPNGKLRYNNSKGTVFSELLFGYDEIVTDKTVTVILVEGIFDKIAVDKTLNLWDDDLVKCCCTFGKKISPVQIEKLKNKLVYKVILLYDFDAIRDIRKFGIELEKYFITSITYTNKKDIDECSRKEALSVFDNLMRPREFNENIIEKIR